MTRATATALTIAALLAVASPAAAHGVASKDALFLESLNGAAVGPLLYLGAKHMVTGYDHLLFLIGVVFFLYRSKDVLLYVSLFTVGHSVTLLAGTLGGWRVSPHVVDAVIGVSIVYKAFENLGGFRRLLGYQPDSRMAVLVFGLFHGLGLATKLQDLTLSRNGLVTNILSFNVGVEIGQVLALSLVLIALGFWRRRPGFAQHAYATNATLMMAGFLCVGFQLAGLVLEN